MQVAPHTLCAPAVSHTFDFNTVSLEALQRFEIPLQFDMGGITQVCGPALSCGLITLSGDKDTPQRPSEFLSRHAHAHCE